jgi:hypothetical protein
LTDQRSAFTASQLRPAKSNAAAAKPPTAMLPRSRSLLAAISNAAKPTTPMASTAADAGFRFPRSRRMTRKGGTCASCSTGGSPNANSRVRPMPIPNPAGQSVAPGSSEPTSPASSARKTKWTA